MEVISPSDYAAEVHRKVQEWPDAGVKAVWVVYPDTKVVTVHRSRQDVRGFSEGDTFDGAPVLPEFSVRVSEFFA